MNLAELTHEQRRLICNGAGPKGWGWLVPDLAFHAAADQHDLDYWIGGRWIEKPVADWRFLNNCLRAAWRRRGGRCLVLILLAFIYFVAVALGGWTCFRYGKRRGQAELQRLTALAATLRGLGR